MKKHSLIRFLEEMDTLTIQPTDLIPEKIKNKTEKHKILNPKKWRQYLQKIKSIQ